LSIFHRRQVSSLEVPTRNLRDFPLSQVIPSFKSSPSSRRTTAENSLCSDSDVFRRRNYHT